MARNLILLATFFLFLFYLVEAQITLQPTTVNFTVYTIELYPVDDYTGGKQFIGLFGDKTRIDVLWYAKYYPESLDPINVTCWLNCNNNTDITQCYGLQNCSSQGKAGPMACTIFNPNYNYFSINNVTCKFSHPNYPQLEYRLSDGTYPKRVFYPIRYAVSVSGGTYLVGRTINLPITFVSYSFLNSNYTGLVYTQLPTTTTTSSTTTSTSTTSTTSSTTSSTTTTTSSTTTSTTTTTLPRSSPIPSPPIITSSFSLFSPAFAQASFISIDNSYNTTDILKYSQIGTVYPKITVIYAGGKTTLYIYTTANELPSCNSVDDCPNIVTQGYQFKACIQKKCQYIFTIEIGSAYLSLPEYGTKELIIIIIGSLLMFLAILKLKIVKN
jgi:hypothetical protein